MAVNFFNNLITIQNSFAIWSFLTLIFLILLYLIRPKPFKAIIPSIIFLEEQKNQKMMKSFFKKMVKNWLFLFQFLILLMICLASLGMFFLIEKNVRSENIIFVIDGSASSKTLLNSNTRFEEAIDFAKKHLGNKNSIVLAKDIPTLILEDGSNRETKKALNGLKPSDSGSNIGDAILFASDLVKEESRIIVLSDFIHTKGTDPLIAKNLVASKGIQINLIDLSNEAKNIGIIDLKIEDEEVTIYIKNFNEKEELVKIKGIEEEIMIAPNSIESIKISLNKGINKIEINNKDDFMTDNKAYVNIPEDSNLRVLIISNEESSFIRDAFQSIPDTIVDFTEPPIINSYDYDIILFEEVNPSLILPGTFIEISKKIEEGTSLVIMAQENLQLIDTANLLPVEIITTDTRENPIINNHLFEFTKDMSFGISNKHLVANLKRNSTFVLAETLEGTPIITYDNYGIGNIVYYGIFDDFNSFKISTDYPVFWLEMSQKLRNRDSIKNLNYRIGDVITIGDKPLKTPSNKILKNSYVLDEVGVYSSTDQKIIVNLLSDKESNIGQIEKFHSSYKFKSVDKEIRTTDKAESMFLFIILALLLIFGELLYIKMRGDL